ncbi:MAG TPA: pseudouridine synthase [Deltaproteobacteria bacterium]|nr:pseudouridine synthase [Deltaproteobacteria bacterium]
MKPMNIPLPTVEGVGPSCLRISCSSGRNILEYLKERFPKVTSASWISRMNKGQVVDEKGVPIKPETPCRRGGFVFYYREPQEETPIPFEEDILYRDDHILVADKPHFLPVVPSGVFLHETLLVRLKKKLALEDLVPLHRIDRETAGLVIFSVNPGTRGDYASLFQKRKVEKVYEALAPTLPGRSFPLSYRSCIVEGKPFFRMREVEGIPNSETRIDVLRETGEIALYRLIPHTGRKHQLRVHLAAMGIPIINDRIYPNVQPAAYDDFSFPLKLLARSISFPDPLTGRDRSFESRRTLS